jgi:hypothetical protein
MHPIPHTAGPLTVEGHSMITYVRFPLNDIPSGDAFNDININSAVLTLPINDSVGAPGKYVVSVALCHNNTWFEKNVTGTTQPCPWYRVKTLDSIIISTRDLPSYAPSWLVTYGVKDVLARTSAEPKITFRIAAEPLCFSLHCTKHGGYLKLFPETPQVSMLYHL